MKKQIIKYLAPIGCLTVGLTAAAPCIACSTNNTQTHNVNVQLLEQDYDSQITTNHLTYDIVGSATTQNNLIVNIKAKAGAGIVNISKIKSNDKKVDQYDYSYYFNGSDDNITLIINGSAVTGDIQIYATTTTRCNVVLMSTSGKFANEWTLKLGDKNQEEISSSFASIMELNFVNCTYKNIDDMREHVQINMGIIGNAESFININPNSIQLTASSTRPNSYLVNLNYSANDELATLLAGEYELNYQIVQDDQVIYSYPTEENNGSSIKLTFQEFKGTLNTNSFGLQFNNTDPTMKKSIETPTFQFYNCNPKEQQFPKEATFTPKQNANAFNAAEDIKVELQMTSSNSYFIKIAHDGDTAFNLTDTVEGTINVTDSTDQPMLQHSITIHPELKIEAIDDQSQPFNNVKMEQKDADIYTITVHIGTNEGGSVLAAFIKSGTINLDQISLSNEKILKFQKASTMFTNYEIIDAQIKAVKDAQDQVIDGEYEIVYTIQSSTIDKGSIIGISSAWIYGTAAQPFIHSRPVICEWGNK